MSVFWFILLCLLMAGSLVFLVYGFSAPLAQAALVFLYVVLGGHYLGWGTFFAVLTAAALAEWLEFTAGMRGTYKAKGSRRSAWGAIIGGIAGAIVFSPFLFPVGSLLGSFGGTFGGAFLMEWTHHGKTGQASLVGTSATWSKFVGFVTKIAISIAITAGTFGWGLMQMFVNGRGG